jgi:HAMP domain-containing protein
MSDDGRALAEWAAKDIGEEPAPAPEPVAAAPEPEPAVAVADEPIVAEAAVEPPAPEEPAVEAEPAPEPAKSKKAVPLPAWMKDRLAEQTAKQREAERLANEAEARAKVFQAELEELRKRVASGDNSPEPARAPAPNGDYVPRSEVERLATEKARMDAFNASADQAYFAGKAAYKDFDDALQPLTAMGALQRMDFQEAALATGAASDVLYELGTDPDRASQILGYLKSGNTAKATAEMTKIALSVEGRKVEAAKPKKTAVSQVPAPIRPVGGSALPTVDMEKADDATFDRELSKMLAAKGW